MRSQPITTSGHFFNIRSNDQFKHYWNKVKLTARLTDFRFHDLRACAITNFFLPAYNFNIPMVAKISGHKSYKELYRYERMKASDIVEQFKKSLSITVKSIGKNNDLDINFIKENPSIDGNSINLTEPNIESLQKNLTYIRAEADAMALEFRLHSKDIHQNFIASNELSNEIFNAVEQSRIEVQGSKIFKGIKSNITKKHIYDLKKNNKTKKNN